MEFLIRVCLNFYHFAPIGKFYFLLPVGKAGLQHQLRLSKSYLTLTEPILRSLTGCGQFTPVMRPKDKSPKVRDFGQQSFLRYRVKFFTRISSVTRHLTHPVQH